MEKDYGKSIYVLDEGLVKENQTKKNKRKKDFKDVYLNLILSVFIFGLAFFVGGLLIRSAIIYDIFEPFSDFIPKETYSDVIRVHNIYLFNQVALYTNVSYLLSLASGIFLLFFYIKDLKVKGWLFMSLLLLFFSAPIEIYNIYCDYKLYYTLRWAGGVDFFDGNIQKYGVERFSAIFPRTLNVVSFLSSLTILTLFVWKPLDKSTKGNNLISNLGVEEITTDNNG